MALPTHVYSDHSGGTVGQTPVAPAGGTILTNDVAFFGFETFDQAITIPTAGTGWTTWTEVTGSPVSPSTDTRLTVFWARATQNDPTMPTSSDSGDHQMYAFSVYRGCETAGNPWNLTVASTQTGTASGSATGGTTTVNDCLILIYTCNEFPDANDQANYASFACTNTANVTKRADRATTAGNGGSIGVATGELATAGSFGPFTFTHDDVGDMGHLIIALQPPVVDFPPKHHQVYAQVAIDRAGSW